MLAPYRARIALAFAALLVSAAMVLVIGEGLKRVIDEGFGRGRADLLDTWVAALAVLIAVLGAVTWLRVYNVYWIGARFTADLRRRVYGHMLGLSPSFFESARTGEVISRLTADVTLVETVMGGTLLYALRMAFTLAGCAVMLVVTSVKLSVLALACLPVVVLPIGLLGRRVRRLSREAQDRQRRDVAPWDGPPALRGPGCGARLCRRSLRPASRRRRPDECRRRSRRRLRSRGDRRADPV